ncbi:MAG TPA: CPBP family intramembrane glutamic endopeptidase [Symbiobacteriaceae bacterium]
MNRRYLILSPLVVIAICHVAARIAHHALGPWAWVPTVMLYWGLLGVAITMGREPAAVRRWLAPARGGRGWTALAILVGLIPLPILVQNRHLLADPVILVCWLLFALINPWFEEFYWRGLLLDATAHWPAWAGAVYSTVLFVAFHPLVAGVFSVANRDMVALTALVLMSLAWTAAYRRTGTLRWAVASHILVDLGNLAVPVFLNLYVPPHLAQGPLQ